MRPADDLSTRDTILHLFKTNGQLSAGELTKRLNITTMAVRRHIEALVRDGYLASTTVRQRMGRPAAVYSLTERADGLFPNKYDTAALDLLEELVQEFGPAAADRLFERRSDSMYKKYAETMKGKDFHGKVAALAQIQQNNGYMARLQKTGEDAYALFEHNCPIMQIANQYSHACHCEMKLFEALLDADISRTECLTQGGRKCEYTIKERAVLPDDHRKKEF